MGVDDGLAAVELLEQREVVRIAEPFIAHIGHQRDAVGLERIERVSGFDKAALDIEDRHRREDAEAAGVIRRLPRREFVPLPRHRAVARLIAALPYGGAVRHREDGGCDAVLVHIVERDRGRPALNAGRAADPAAHQLENRRRMVMNVDAMRLGHAFLPAAMYYNRLERPKEEAVIGQNEMLEEYAVKRVRQVWAFARDHGEWDRMRACFHPDATVRVLWYSGPVAGFLDETIEAAKG